MAEDRAIDALARYVPRHLRVRAAASAGLAPAEPTLERFQCALLFADISGFTPLTETLAERGRAGTEELSSILNGYFTHLIDQVEAYGGDVLKFAGDALLAVWITQESSAGTRPTSALHTAAWQVAQCASDIQSALDGYEVSGFVLRLRTAVGAGELRMLHLGGLHERWEFALLGDALRQVTRGVEHAPSGACVISPEVAELLADEIAGDTLPGGAVRLRMLSPPPKPATLPSVELDAGCSELLRAYLPESLLYHLEGGNTVFVGELRRASVLFVGLPELDEATPLERAHAWIRAIQRVIAAPLEGSLNKLSVDEKGVSVVIVFGLPPHAHEDDPARAIRAALSISEELRAERVACSIGVSTGRVYCGATGSQSRREYTILGDSVNVAARLMQAAAGGILCDETTMQRSSESIELAPPLELSLKGKAHGCLAYRPLGMRRRERELAAPVTLIGRDRELGQLRAALERAVIDSHASTWLIEGEAGIGKSTLVGELLREASRHSIPSLRSACEAIEHSTLYFAWRSIVAELIDLDPSALAAGDREPLVDRLSAALESPELVPLLGDLLGVALPDTSLTAEMQGEVRADNTSELVVRLCARRAAGAPLILCIEDVHWMDSASWSLLLKLRHQIPRLLMLLLTRPMAAPPVELQRMREHPATHVLRLEPLPASDCAALVAARLGIPALPDAIAQWVQERAEGHPFFAEELGYAIRDAGILEVSNGHCELAAGSEDLAALDLPDTVEGIITSRIDRLETDAQLTLKVASVIGRSFELPVLAAIHPLGTTVAQLDRQLDGLSRLELTCREQVGAQCAHLFKHAITRQVAYGLMLFSQRHALHAEIAAFFETRPAEELRSLAPLLAHHWGHAGVAEKAIGYLEQAAESALRSHANAEAIGFLRDALEWSRTDETRVSERRRTSWIAMLGEAEIGMGRLSEARRHLEEVVERLGYEIPAASSGLIAALAREIARQCGLRWARRAAIRREDERGEDAALAARACERLFLIYFFAGDAPRALLGTLRAVNLAERSRSAGDVLARCFASLGVALGSIPLHRMARAYLSRALASCDPHALSARSWIHLGAATYWAGVGAWDQVESHARQGLELAEQLGDWRRWEELAASLCLMRMIHGELDASDAALHAQVLASGRRREVVQAQGWGLCEAALTLCALEDWKSLSPVLDQVEQLLARHGDQVDVVTRLEGRAALARSAVAHGDSNRAHTLLETALRDLTAMGPPTQYRNLPGVSTLVEALLAAIDDCIDPVQLLLYDAWLERISGYLRRYARMFAIGRSRRDFVRAQIERRRGRLRRARTWLEASLQHARRSNLRIDELRALEALAAMGAVGDPDAALARGRELRRQLGLPARSLPAGVSRRGSSC